MTKPLICLPSMEKSISLCLQRLHKCFAVPASDFWCLPAILLQPYVHIIFLIHCKIHQSVSHLRKTVEDLLFSFLSKCNDSLVKSVLRCIIYLEEIPEVIIHENFSFAFGEDGGVKLVEAKKSERSLEEFGDALMILLERKDHNGALGNKLFMTLLEFVSISKEELVTIDAIEKHLVTVKLLAVLSENPTVQKSLSKNPHHVVKFLKTLLDKFLTEEVIESEIISIALVVLGVILNDCLRSKNCCWDDFSILEDPLSRLRFTTKSAEIRMLAEETYEVVLTHGGVKPQQSKVSTDSNHEKYPKQPGTFEEALQEACDPLLPVRGHALMQLAKLLATGDKKATTKKDQILCIFQVSSV